MHNRSLSSNGSFTKFNTHNIGKSVLWDSSNKLNHNLNLPNFSIGNEVVSTPLVMPTSNQSTFDPAASTPSSQLSSFQKLSLDTTITLNNNNHHHHNQHNQHNQHNHNNNNNFHDLNSNTTNTNANGGLGLGGYKCDINGDNKENILKKHDNESDAAVNGSGFLYGVLSEANSTSSASTPPSTNYPNMVPAAGGFPQKIDKDYLASIGKVPLAQLKPEILKLAKDQHGCRFLQKKIDENLILNCQTRINNFEVIFDQIYPYMHELIIDPFGNYLVQKMIVYCSQANLNLVLEILQYNLYQISINQHGTRALQKIIDNLNSASQLSLLIQGLKPHIIDLIKDLNGNHVIQKILNKYQPTDCQFIYESIIETLYTVATHKHGCCVLQKCLNHVTPVQLGQFSEAILCFDNFRLLINDQFGNYVLQYLISINSLEVNYHVFQNFVKYGITNLCNSKFSSNVVERYLKNCFNNEVVNIAFAELKLELIHKVLTNELNMLINDPYGNYVIQTLIDILINTQVSYQNVEKLSLLLPSMSHQENLPGLQGLQGQSLQVVIIKYWFQNCKIVSSFGKRIQSKINTILNNNNVAFIASASSKDPRRSSQMNANGEFVINDGQGQYCKQLGPSSRQNQSFTQSNMKSSNKTTAAAQKSSAAPPLQSIPFRNSLAQFDNRNGRNVVEFNYPYKSVSTRTHSVAGTYYAENPRVTNNNYNVNSPTAFNNDHHHNTNNINNNHNNNNTINNNNNNNNSNSSSIYMTNVLTLGHKNSTSSTHSSGSTTSFSNEALPQAPNLVPNEDPSGMGDYSIQRGAALKQPVPFDQQMNPGNVDPEYAHPQAYNAPYYPANVAPHHHHHHHHHSHHSSVSSISQSHTPQQQLMASYPMGDARKEQFPPVFGNGFSEWPMQSQPPPMPTTIQGHPGAPTANRNFIHHSHNSSWSPATASAQSGPAFSVQNW
ncbi:uncharacterized protein LODBEIA_P15080 [Lodderomyces beijingensis]|uniref:PUM-HD domain-containing protein n=1 Tax=Lodderomyces beijingensis TaxID=1775926 RepID=A0ABP0ZGI8_9ASCO